MSSTEKALYEISYELLAQHIDNRILRNKYCPVNLGASGKTDIRLEEAKGMQRGYALRADMLCRVFNELIRDAHEIVNRPEDGELYAFHVFLANYFTDENGKPTYRKQRVGAYPSPEACSAAVYSLRQVGVGTERCLQWDIRAKESDYKAWTADEYGEDIAVVY